MKILKTVTTNKSENRIEILDSMRANFVRYLDVAPLTVQTYTSGLKQFFSYIRINGVKKPDKFSVIEFKKALIEKGCKPSTIASYLTAIKKFFTWTEAEGLYPNIASNIKAPKQDKGFKRVALSAEQVRDVIRTVETTTLQGLRDKAILALMSVCGLRCCEVVRADIGDIRINSGETVLYVLGKARVSKVDFVKLPVKVMKCIREYLSARGATKDNEPLFASCSRRNFGRRLTTRTISSIAKRAMVAVGLVSSRLSAHSLRHSSVTIALLNGMSIQEVSYFARHRNITTTLCYSHNINRLQSACERTIENAIFC